MMIKQQCIGVVLVLFFRYVHHITKVVMKRE